MGGVQAREAEKPEAARAEGLEGYGVVTGLQSMLEAQAAGV